MATPSAMSFHDESRRVFRDIAMNKVKYNKQRWELNTYNRAFKGFPKTSTGSWNTPFGWAMNDNGKPFNPLPGASAQGARLKGGIRDNVNYPKVKQLLQQRARDMDFQDNPDIPVAVPMETLTDDDKLKLELNNTLLRIDDLVETGDYSPLTQDLWRKVVVLLATIAPKLDEYALNQQIEYWDNVYEGLNADIVEKGDASAQLKRNKIVRREYADAIRKYVVGMAGAVNRPEKERILLSKALLKEFGLTSTNVNKVIKDAKEKAAEEVARLIGPSLERDEMEVGEQPISEAVDEMEEGEGDEEEKEGTIETTSTAPARGSLPSAAFGPSPTIINAEKAKSLAKFDKLYNRSPVQPAPASDELDELYAIVAPRARNVRSRLQVRNAVRYLLTMDTPLAVALRRKIEELVPGS